MLFINKVCVYLFYVIVDFYCLIISQIRVLLKMRQVVSERYEEIINEVSAFLSLLNRI